MDVQGLGVSDSLRVEVNMKGIIWSSVYIFKKSCTKHGIYPIHLETGIRWVACLLMVSRPYKDLLGDHDFNEHEHLFGHKALPKD